MTYAPANTLSNYLPIEFQVEGNEEFFRQLIAERERLTATILNVKESSQYELIEILNAQQWFSTSSATTKTTSYAFRLTFDLVALNAGVAIPGGVTTLALTATTQPPLINIPTAIQPLHGFGAANNGTNFYFINDPLVFVRTNIWNNVTQQIIITNNSGAALTQAVWVFEYLKT